MKRVIVAGGGAAGISAALSASHKGFDVTLVESLNRLGGRLGSFQDKKSGQKFDYGEHLILGGYTETLKLLKMMNCEDDVSIQPQLNIPFYHPQKDVHRFSLPDISPPFNFLTGIMKNRMLSFKERLKLIGQLRRLTAENFTHRITASEWLRDTPQNLLDSFWKPVIISVMNCLPEEADMQIVKTAFEKGFLQKGGLGFFMKPQSEIFDENARKSLESAGVSVRLGSQITKLIFRDNEVVSLELDGGENIDADYFILALPPKKVHEIIGDEGILSLENIIYEYTDICNLHLVFEREIFGDDFGCLLKALPQWFFKRRWKAGDSKGIGYSLTISAADKLILPDIDIVETCLTDLRSCGAELDGNRLLYSKVVMSKEATIILTPEASGNRPGPSTNLKNLFIAGDWTDTGLPATIESAVMSGFKAAEMLENYTKS